MGKLLKLESDVKVLERDLKNVEHKGVKNVIENMIARKRMAIARMKALDELSKKIKY